MQVLQTSRLFIQCRSKFTLSCLEVNRFDVGLETYHTVLQQQYNVYKHLSPDPGGGDRGIDSISSLSIFGILKKLEYIWN